MKLHHYIFGIALAALLGACSSEELATTDKAQAASEDNLTLTISLPGSEFNNPYALNTSAKTRAATVYNKGKASCSGLGGISNLDMTKYDVRYKIAVYENTAATGQTASYTQRGETRTITVDNYQEITTSFRLLPTHTYRIVCWADFVNQGETDDLHYNTADLTKITVKDESQKNLNDESRDAYFRYADFTVPTEGNLTGSIVLKRPFAKIRLVTTDWNYGNLTMPKKVKITYPTTVKRFTGLNAVTGCDIDGGTGSDVSTAIECTADLTDESGNSTKTYLGYSVVDGKNSSYNGNSNVGVDDKPDDGTQESDKDKFTEKETSARIVQDYDYDPHQATLAVDYLWTDEYTDDYDGTENKNGGESKIQFKYEAFSDTDGNSLLYTHNFTTDIPYKRNYITTILGNLLTVGGKFDVAINENFKNEWVYAEPWWDPTKLTPKSPTVETDANGKKTYHVYNRDQFAWLVNKANANTAFTAGVYLEHDIDMNNIDWTPIFCGDNNGYFNGNNYALRNFDINNARSESGAIYQSWGVFGTYKGKIENVTFENVTINGLQGSSGHDQGLGFAGAPIGMFAGELSNVHTKHFFIRSKIKYVDDIKLPNGTVMVPGGWTPSCTGGIVGCLFPNVQYLTGKNYSLTTPWDESTMCTIKNCSAEDIHTLGEFAGGLIGLVGYGYVIENCSTDYVYILSPINAGRFIGGLGNNVWLKTDNATTDNAFFTDNDGNTALASDGSNYVEDDKQTGHHLWGHLMGAVGTWPGTINNQWVSGNSPFMTTLVQAVYTGNSSSDNIKYADK